MKLHVDKESDALHLRLDESVIVESEEVAPGVVVDYNESDEVVGVEWLGLSKRVGVESVGAQVNQGLIMSMPQSEKSFVFLAAICASRDRVIAAIWQSA